MKNNGEIVPPLFFLFFIVIVIVRGEKMKNIKKLTAFVLILFAALSLFANGSAEDTKSFSSLDFSTLSISEIEKNYEKAKENYEKSRTSLLERAEKAYEERNVDEYLKLRNLLDSLDYPVVTEEMTDTLLERLLNTADESEKKEIASFLYENSAYYHPALTLYIRDESKGSVRTYSKSISIKPGESITLPLASSFNGSLIKGWSINKTDVLYAPGEEIEMPYSDTVLYAVLTSGISFTDDVTGYSYMTEEDSADVSIPEAADSSYVFSGWYDTVTGKLLEDETVTVEEGKSRSFKAQWKKIDLSDGNVKYYSSDSVPSGTQVIYNTTLTVGGNSRLKDVTVTLEGDDAITVLSGDKYFRSLKSGDCVNLSFAFVLSGESGEKVDAVLSATDDSGSVWKKTITFTIK